MDPWAWAVIGAATILGMFVGVMGFRGLIDTLDQDNGRCTVCGRIAALPLPPTSHACLHCRAHRLLGRRLSLRH
jgi:hypothetical protein